MFNDVELSREDDGMLVLRGISAQNFLSDVARIYRYSINTEEPQKTKLFFSTAVNGILFKNAAIRFHKYFALELYFIFEKLYDITRRGIYKSAMNALSNEPCVSKYFTPPLSLPSDVTSRLDMLSVKLFPFQQHFIESYYNAKNKLGLDGMILAYEAGLGKTFTAIAAVWAFNIMPCIITAPLSTLAGWKKSILRMIPGIKESQVKISNEYNPNKDKDKWLFYICNYERMEMAIEHAKYAKSNVVSLLIDESHNMRNMDTKRVQTLIHLKNTLNIHNIIAISGTPIKALASELVGIMSIIDPEFDEKARMIFKRIYSRNSYDPISASVLRNKLSMYIERKKQEDSIKLPPLERYNVFVKLSDPTPYLCETVKDEIWKYVHEYMPEYQKEVQPNFDKLEKMIQNPVFTNNIEKEKIDKYINLVKIKMHNPFDERLKEDPGYIKYFETEMLRPLSSESTKEIIAIRRNCTSYVQILLGRGIGEYFVRGKIRAIVQMVKENSNEIAKIIKSGEMKTLIFSTFMEPLYSVKDELEKVDIGCVLHVGGMDAMVTMNEFKQDDKQALLATAQSVGTGTDGYQFIANQLIHLNISYRSVDLDQNSARIHRQGTPASVIKIFFLRLDTGNQPNILERESDINMWSRAMFKMIID